MNPDDSPDTSPDEEVEEVVFPDRESHEHVTGIEEDLGEVVVEAATPQKLVLGPDNFLRFPKWAAWSVVIIVVLSVAGSVFSTITSRNSASDAAHAAQEAASFSDKLLAENVQYAKEVRCLRGSTVTLDEATVEVLSVFADSQTVILDGLSASAENDDVRLGTIVLDANRVITLLKNGKTTLASAITLRKAAYDACTPDPLPGQEPTVVPGDSVPALTTEPTLP